MHSCQLRDALQLIGTFCSYHACVTVAYTSVEHFCPANLCLAIFWRNDMYQRCVPDSSTAISSNTFFSNYPILSTIKFFLFTTKII